MLSLRFAVVVCISYFLTQPVSAFSYYLFGGVTQLNSTSGEPTYDFSLSLNEWLHNYENISLELVSPKGVRFSETPTFHNGVHVSLQGILPADINSTASGVWTIEETIDGSQLNEYQFTVPQILNSSKFRRVPVITSPLDGATVGPVFDVTWTNPVSGSLGFSMRYAEGTPLPLEFPDSELNAPGDATFSYLGVSGEDARPADIECGQTHPFHKVP